MDGINRANTSSPTPTPSSNHVKKQRLLRSWPTSISRYIPGWIPYCILRVMNSVATTILYPFFCIVFIYHVSFSSTDLWGVPSERLRERWRAREWKQYKKEEEYWKPMPLMSHRKRRLSLPLEEKVKKAGWWNWRTKEPPQQSLDQMQSPVGRLPEELRKLIYYYIVAGKCLHVQQSYKRFGFVECISNDGSGTNASCVQLLPCLKPHLNLSVGVLLKAGLTGSRMRLSSYDGLRIKPEIMEGNRQISPGKMLSLAKTCRFLYTGYISSIYSLTTFAFTSLNQFQIFSTTIPPHHLNKITSLQFSSELLASFRDRFESGWEEVKESQWKPAWETIATMQQLRVLRVDLRLGSIGRVRESSSSGVHRWMEEMIFGPMKGVQQTSIYEVTVNWVESSGFMLGEVPFKFERVLGNTAWSDRHYTQQV